MTGLSHEEPNEQSAERMTESDLSAERILERLRESLNGVRSEYETKRNRHKAFVAANPDLRDDPSVVHKDGELVGSREVANVFDASLERIEAEMAASRHRRAQQTTAPIGEFVEVNSASQPS